MWSVSPVGNVHFVGEDRVALCGRWTLNTYDTPPPPGPYAKHCAACERLLHPLESSEPEEQRATRAHAAAKRAQICTAFETNPRLTWAELAERFDVTPRIARHAVQYSVTRHAKAALRLIERAQGRVGGGGR